jgi:hypothetical protein
VTIAVCYLSPEGVVLGADSTSSLSPAPGRFHFFNHNQKIFEIGENSTLAILTWGLGGLGALSYRTLIADLAHDLESSPPGTVREVASRWGDRVWPAYTATQGATIALVRQLGVRPPYDPKASPAVPNARSEDEEGLFQTLRRNMVVGFCLGGYVLPDRTPRAYHMSCDPLADKPDPIEIPQLVHQWWGAPNVMQRLIFGADDNLRHAILTSPHWKGTGDDLNALLADHRWSHPTLPIRDAIDFVYSCIYSTIKAMKFSNFDQVCGGPIEIGVITTDRRFRWVRHKEWDVAITEGTP